MANKQIKDLTDGITPANKDNIALQQYATDLTYKADLDSVRRATYNAQTNERISNENTNVGVQFGLQSPMINNDILLIGDYIDFDNIPTTGTINGVIINGTDLGIPDIMINHSNYDDNMEAYIIISDDELEIKYDSIDGYLRTITLNDNRIYLYSSVGNGSTLESYLSLENDKAEFGLSDINGGKCSITDGETLIENNATININAFNNINIVSGSINFTTNKVVMDNLPTFADDTIAGVNGLTSGRVYKTSTGEVRIKL